MGGMGRTFRRGPVWWIAYYQDGCEYRESSNSRFKRDAVVLLKQRLVRRSPAGEERLMFEDLVELILTDYRANSRRSTDATMGRIKHLRCVFGEVRAIDITASRIRAYQGYRLDEGAAPGTVNRRLACLRRMFSLALVDDLISRAPRVPMLEGEKVREGFVGDDSFTRLLSCLPAHLQPLVEFLYLSGWRKAEAQNLLWKNVRLKEQVVILARRDSKNKEPRTLPLAGRLLGLIQEQNQGRRLHCPYVFHRAGRQIRDFRWSWKLACKESGNDGVLVHDLRRSAARNLRRAGVSESVAMKITGHRTASVFRRYDISDEQDIREAMERVAGGQKTDSIRAYPNG